MADLKCTWGIVRTDVYEYVTEENCTLPELLEEVKALVEAWDDPSKECPPFQLCRVTPDDRAVHEEHTKRILESRQAMGLFNG